MKLEGKIVDFLGDSITEGVGVKDCENNRCDNRIKNSLPDLISGWIVCCLPIRQIPHLLL